MKTYHTVLRIVSEDRQVSYTRIADDYYESADYYEKYYADSYSYPKTYSAVVVNQFITEDEE